jgi:hypothetical protein
MGDSSSPHPASQTSNMAIGQIRSHVHEPMAILSPFIEAQVSARAGNQRQASRLTNGTQPQLQAEFVVDRRPLLPDMRPRARIGITSAHSPGTAKLRPTITSSNNTKGLVISKSHQAAMTSPMTTRSSLMSDLAVCFAAIAAQPDSPVPHDKLVANFESNHRSTYSAKTVTNSWVIDNCAATKFDAKHAHPSYRIGRAKAIECGGRPRPSP